MTEAMTKSSKDKKGDAASPKKATKAKKGKKGSAAGVDSDGVGHDMEEFKGGIDD